LNIRGKMRRALCMTLAISRTAFAHRNGALSITLAEVMHFATLQNANMSIVVLNSDLLSQDQEVVNGVC
jgi:hypothetical protein